MNGNRSNRQPICPRRLAFGDATLIRGLMSDEEWTCLEPFVIERGARSGRRPRDHCLVLDGIFWIARDVNRRCLARPA